MFSQDEGAAGLVGVVAIPEFLAFQVSRMTGKLALASRQGLKDSDIGCRDCSVWHGWIPES